MVIPEKKQKTQKNSHKMLQNPKKKKKIQKNPKKLKNYRIDGKSYVDATAIFKK